jgi:hypothetical protein
LLAVCPVLGQNLGRKIPLEIIVVEHAEKTPTEN